MASSSSNSTDVDELSKRLLASRYGELACLRAPLTISNVGKNWITGLYACEYSGLFRGILPFLALHRFPIPLGGTSNHFRIGALRACRGWDPYNVAEDADLGLRMHRLGYYCGAITAETLADASSFARIALAVPKGEIVYFQEEVTVVAQVDIPKFESLHVKLSRYHVADNRRRSAVRSFKLFLWALSLRNQIAKRQEKKPNGPQCPGAPRALGGPWGPAPWALGPSPLYLE